MSTFLLKEDGGHLLKEDTGKILLLLGKTIPLPLQKNADAKDCWPDLAEIKAELGITNATADKYLARHRLVAIQRIENYTGRVFCYGTYSEEINPQDGFLIPRAQPVSKLISSTEISCHCLRKHGNISTFAWPAGRGCGAGTVVYEGGFEEIPADVVDVFWQMMEYANSQQGQAPSSAGQVKKETVMGVVSVEYAVDPGSSATGSGSSSPGVASYYASSLAPYILRGA